MVEQILVKFLNRLRGKEVDAVENLLTIDNNQPLCEVLVGT